MKANFPKLKYVDFQVQVSFQRAFLVCLDAWGCVKVSGDCVKEIQCFMEVQGKIVKYSVLYCTVL